MTALPGQLGGDHNQEAGGVHVDGPEPSSPRPSDISASGRPWPSLSAVALFIVLAVGLLAGSFFVPVAQARTVAQGHIGPISTAAGQPQATSLPSTLAQHRSRTLTVDFTFSADDLVTGDTLFQVGRGVTALRAVVNPVVKNTRSVALITLLPNRHAFSAVLVGHIETARTYAVEISIDNGRSLSARVDGTLQFAYSYPSPEFAPGLDLLVVGGASSQGHAFHGSVAGFTLAYSQLGLGGADVGPVVLRVASGLFFALALVLLFSRQEAIIGLLLLACGVAAIAALTPVDNIVVQQSGFQRMTTASVSPGTWVGADVGTEPSLFQATPIVDVHL